MFNYLTNLTWPKLAKITFVLIGFFIAFIFSFCLFKYYTYLYNGIDLAIFNQVFFNSTSGRLFNFTIHPTSYLGDHFEIIIFFLLPFYSLFKSPLTLLFLQACFVGFSAIPLYLIAKKHLSPLLGLMVVCLYLFNPATLNLCLYEFHILPLTIFFALWAFYFYDQNKFKPFLIFCLLCLLVREDVALIIFMFGLIALLDRKKLKWIITPLILSSVYFILALKISAYFSASSSYKFLAYYSWLGNTLGGIFINFFLKFPAVLGHVFLNITHWEMILSLLLIMFFLPLYRPKYLLLALPVLLEFVLGPNSGLTIIESHYISLFYPALLIAAIFSLQALSQNYKIIKFNQDYKEVFPIIFAVCLLFLLWQLGPLTAFIRVPLQTDYQQVAAKNEFAKLIPTKASVLTTFDLLAKFSSRAKLYFFKYAYLNKQQFSFGQYELPQDLDYIFLNFDDLLTLDLSYSHNENYRADYFQGDDRFKELLSNYTLIKIDKNLGLWQRGQQDSDLSLFETANTAQITHKKNEPLGSSMEFLGYDQNQMLTSLYFECLEPMDKNYFLEIANHYYPLGYGIYPTSAWQKGQIIKLNFYGFSTIKSLKVAGLDGYFKKNKLSSYSLYLTDVNVLGEINLP